MIEFIQFKKKLYDIIIQNEEEDNEKKEDNDDMIEDINKKFLKLPESCPKSTIVYNNKNNKSIARSLYLKYIMTGSEWEINISYTQRKRYEYLMNNENIWSNECPQYNNNKALYGLFDGCISEMTSLIQSAFTRFKKTEKFLLLKKVHNTLN